MSRPPLRRRLRSALLDFFLRSVAPVLGRLSWPRCQSWGRSLGSLLWHFARRERQRALVHLEIAFPELAEDERKELAKKCFRHLGCCIGETLHLLAHDCEVIRKQVEVEGWENVESLREQDRPTIILTGHCGNWEILAAAINCRGLDMAVVARGQQDERLDDFIARFRGRFGTTTIARAQKGAARTLLRQLRKGGALGMLIDQDTRVDGVWVPFFGQQAFTPVGAANIALRQGAAVVPAFIERRNDGTHLARFQPALELSHDATEATAQMTAKIEEQIRSRPEQWVWMHRRWRRRPASEAARSS